MIPDKGLLAELAEDFRIRRIKSTLSREMLAQRAGVHINTIGRIERGEIKNFEINTLQKVAGAMGRKLKISLE